MINYIEYTYARSKGATPEGQVFASSINMGPSDKDYTSDLVKDEIVAAAGAVSAAVNLPWYPVKLATVTLSSGGDSAIVTNFTTGALGGTGVFTTPGFVATVLPSGVLTITSFNGGAALADVTITYRFDNESVRNDGPTAAGFTKQHWCVA